MTSTKKIEIEKISTLKGHDGAVYALEKSPELNKFFSGSGDKIVAEWDLETNEPAKALVNVGAVVYSIKYIEEKNILLIGTSAGAIHVVDLTSRKETRNIAFHQSSIFNIQYSPLHKKIFAASGDGSVTFWSSDDFTMLYTVKLCKEKVRGLSVNLSQTVLAVACGDGTIRLLDIASMKEFLSIEAHQLSANTVCFHPDNNYLLSGGRDAHIKIWSTSDFSLIKSIPAHNYAVYAFSFSPDKKYIASASRDKTVKIWDSETFHILQRIDKEKNDGHLNSVNNVLWLENGVLLSTGDDRSVCAWKVQAPSGSSPKEKE